MAAIKENEASVDTQPAAVRIFETSTNMKKIWRPWVDAPEDRNRRLRSRFAPYNQESLRRNRQQHPQFKHPVRLYWTKAAYDYMYAWGETLLRNFPVQATIQVVDWSSDSSDDEDSGDEQRKEKET